MKFFLQAIVCSSDVFFRCPGWLNRPNFPRKIEAPSNGLLPFMEQRQSWSWNSWKAWYQWPQRHYAPFFLHQQVWLQLENKRLDVLECGTCPTSCSTCRDHPWWCQAGSSFEVASSGKDLYFWVRVSKHCWHAHWWHWCIGPFQHEENEHETKEYDGQPMSFHCQACRTSGLRLGFFEAFLPIIRRVDRMPTWKQPEIHWLRGSYGIGLTRARFCRQGGPRWIYQLWGRFSTYYCILLSIYLLLDRQTDRIGRMDGWMDRWMDGWIDR